jgi:hypothetical protein
MIFGNAGFFIGAGASRSFLQRIVSCRILREGGQETMSYKTKKYGAITAVALAAAWGIGHFVLKVI